MHGAGKAITIIVGQINRSLIPSTAEMVIAACALAKAGYGHSGKSKLSKQFKLHHYNKGICHPETLKGKEIIKITCL